VLTRTTAGGSVPGVTTILVPNRDRSRAQPTPCGHGVSPGSGTIFSGLASERSRKRRPVFGVLERKG
jgi:hypothetical protein